MDYTSECLKLLNYTSESFTQEQRWPQNQSAVSWTAVM